MSCKCSVLYRLSTCKLVVLYVHYRRMGNWEDIFYTMTKGGMPQSVTYRRIIRTQGFGMKTSSLKWSSKHIILSKVIFVLCYNVMLSSIQKHEIDTSLKSSDFSTNLILDWFVMQDSFCLAIKHIHVLMRSGYITVGLCSVMINRYL